MKTRNIPDYFRKLLDLPVIFWILAGFFVTYLVFFIKPAFFNSAFEMYFPEYVRAVKPIGCDLNVTLVRCKLWIFKNLHPYEPGHANPPLALIAYPPLALIIYALLCLLNYPAVYIFIVMLMGILSIQNKIINYYLLIFLLKK